MWGSRSVSFWSQFGVDLGSKTFVSGTPILRVPETRFLGPPFGSHFGQSGAKLGKIAAFFTKIGSLKATTARKRQYCQLPGQGGSWQYCQLPGHGGRPKQNNFKSDSGKCNGSESIGKWLVLAAHTLLAVQMRGHQITRIECYGKPKGRRHEASAREI